MATGATGALTSTAAQVAAAINAHPGAFAKLVAQTYRGNAGTGIVQARPKGNLSDFLTTATNAHVQRGPFEYFVMRIGKNRPGNSADQGVHGRRVGVFLYCQQHAREWATPLTCLETAEQLLRNYGIDKTTRKLVDELDIFILPSSNPDGAHYSMHNFNSQRTDDDQLVHVRRRSRPTTRTRRTSGRRGRTRSREASPSRSTTRRPAMPGAPT